MPMPSYYPRGRCSFRTVKRLSLPSGWPQVTVLKSEWFYLKACIPVEWPLLLTGRVSCIFADHKNPPALYGAERPLFYGMLVKWMSAYTTSECFSLSLKPSRASCSIIKVQRQLSAWWWRFLSAVVTIKYNYFNILRYDGMVMRQKRQKFAEICFRNF